MIADRNAGNTSPLTWIGSFPVYASTVIAAAHAVTMVLTALAMAMGAEALIQTLQFSSHSVLGNFAVWQLATYAFVHPPQILFLLEIYLLVVFGRELESFLGRRTFLGLYAALLLAPPAILTFAGLFGVSTIYSGSSALHFAVFLAFSTLYPHAEVFFGIQARWVALALLAISVLQDLAYGHMAGLFVLLVSAIIAYAGVRWIRGDWTLTDLFPVRRKPALRVVRPSRDEEPAEPLASIDAILEKISRSGMSSLTARERGRLEQARSELIEKDRKH